MLKHIYKSYIKIQNNKKYIPINNSDCNFTYNYLIQNIYKYLLPHKCRGGKYWVHTMNSDNVIKRNRSQQ